MRRAVLVALVVVAAVVPAQAAGAGSPGGPKVLVEPDVDLADGQTVRVSGAGFTPDIQVALVECDAEAVDPDGCDLGNLAFVDVDEEGVFDTTFQVERVIHTTAFGDEDCARAPGTCRLVAANVVDTTEAASTDLDFDETLPLPHPLRIEVALRREAILRSDGQVLVQGTFTCNRRATAQLDIEISQQAVPEDAVGHGFVFIERCLGTVTFQTLVSPQPGSGLFRPRNAVADLNAFANVGDDFVDSTAVVRMTLRR